MKKLWKATCAFVISILAVCFGACAVGDNVDSGSSSSDSNLSVDNSGDTSDDDSSDSSGDSSDDDSSNSSGDISDDDSSNSSGDTSDDDSSNSSGDISDDDSSDSSGDSSDDDSSGDDDITVNTYTVAFDVNGGTGSVADATVQEGGKVQKPTDPTKEYYTFDGWYNGETPWNFENDEVTANVTLIAKWTAKTYTVKFVDFDKNETEVTYTAETVEQFALLVVPSAPTHYENARWSKTLEECTVYSETAIVVEAIADPVNYTVTFVNGGEIAPVEVAYNTTLASTEATARPGFIFKGWYYNGNEYDFTTPVTGDMTLVARWNVSMGVGEKFEISAGDIEKDATVEVGYVSKNGVGAMPGGNGWYYDSDYITDWDGSATERLLSDCVTFGVTADGGNGTVEEAVERTVIFPAINYTQYAKVDFGYTIGATATKLTLCGTEVPTTGNKLVSIVEKTDGMYAVVREVNDANVQVEIKLPEAVANGETGIAFVASVKGYTSFNVTEFHVTNKGQVDYLAKMAEAVVAIENATTDEARLNALTDYDKYAAYRTEYEKSLGEPEEIATVRESVYYNAVANAENGSQAQYEAIVAYRAYCDTLSDAGKASDVHQTNVAAVNAIIEQYFSEAVKISFDAVATLTTSAGSERNVAFESNGNSKFNDTTKYPYTTFSYSNGNTASATFTLNAFNYAAYDEVYFGIAHAMTYATAGSITIAGETYTVPSSWYGGYTYRMKAVISDGYLTLYEDGSQEAGMAVEPYYLKVKLSESVLNGTEALVIEFTQGGTAYAWLEVTNMIATADVKKID